MVSHFQEHESLFQNSIFDALYCEEERFEEVLGGGFDFQSPEIEDSNEIHTKHLVFLFEHDGFWEDDELANLLSKEKREFHLSYNELNSDGSLIMARKEAIKWMLKVIAHYGFTAMTAVLSVNYYDRFITSLCFQKDKPWMSQLTAVACLSLAAKVEETQVPLLLDLQVEESKYLFEAKTIQRMEILVLSTLKWKMNPVTPISFFDHSLRRFGLMTNLHWKFMRRCESFLLSIITDHKLAHYLPSVIAGATMIYVIREIEPCSAMKYENQLMNVLKISKESIDECSKLIREVMDGDDNKPCLKRKLENVPSSPYGVIDAYFSSDSSRESWVISSPVSSSPEPLFKRSRARDQHMRLAPLSSVSVSVGSTPR
ncbi:cyclin-D3-3-like isoform X1 [Olea europaea subsp. europaea]|uniref:Cyclin-D3-3-like isoform X1 n=1 Tax=Olea europaea subsp. europaea TaxID=158383 RepID=A0A8S0VFA1_OLEEU|nr:cyclin-D3-3-like isoform X1 [Olea europaea subsp. europaea]